MSQLLTAKTIKEIVRGIRAGKCLTLIPTRRGSVKVLESSEFLSPEESEAFLKTLA
jgi:hypothetical protein